MKRFIALLFIVSVLGLALAEKSPPGKRPDFIDIPVIIGQANAP